MDAQNKQKQTVENGNEKPYQKETQEQLRKRLTPEQYRVTQQNKTEDAYKNKFHKFFKKGVYKCVVCSMKLFSSDHKFESGCGWPAFFGELQNAKIKKISNKSHGLVKTELRCVTCDSHLGHLFIRGNQKVRYCVNSASMAFEELS